MSELFARYPEYEYTLASAQLILAMLGMGALLAPKDFAEVVRNPRSLLVGLGLQLTAVPLVAMALGLLLPLDVGIAAGLVLVAAVPGGTMSNVITYLARANIALSIALTAITTIGSLAITPLLLRLLIGAYLPPDFEMPTGRLAFEIGVNLLGPLGAGMAIGMLLPDWRDAISKWSIRGSLTVIAVMIVGASGAGRIDAMAYGAIGPLAVLGLSLGAQIVARLLTRAAALPAADRAAIVIEVTVRNTNLALMLKASLFPATDLAASAVGDGMFFVALLYGGFAMLVVTPPVLAHRRRVPA